MINEINSLSPQLSSYESEDAASVMPKNSGDLEPDSKLNANEGSEEATGNLQDALAGDANEKHSMPQLPSEILTQIQQHATEDTANNMSVANKFMRDAVNANVKSVTLKEPDGRIRGKGAALSEAGSTFRSTKNVTLKGEAFKNGHLGDLTSFKALQSVTLDRNDVTGDIFSKLPRDLQSVRVVGLGKVEDDQLKDLPPNLKTFASLGVNITADSIKNLPRKMESLGILDDTRNVPTITGTETYPPNLKRVLIASRGMNDLGIPDLPKNIKQMDLLATGVTGSSIKNIPESVHTLGLPFSYKNMDGLKDLSKNVHTLTISGRADSHGIDVSDDVIKSLPRTVRNLSLVGDVSPERLQKLRTNNPGVNITTVSEADYMGKVTSGLRGKGDFAFS